MYSDSLREGDGKHGGDDQRVGGAAAGEHRPESRAGQHVTGDALSCSSTDPASHRCATAAAAPSTVDPTATGRPCRRRAESMMPPEIDLPDLRGHAQERGRRLQQQCEEDDADHERAGDDERTPSRPTLVAARGPWRRPPRPAAAAARTERRRSGSPAARAKPRVAITVPAFSGASPSRLQGAAARSDAIDGSS